MKHVYFGDLCRCNNCMALVLVDVYSDTCPNCGTAGCLTDIQQECELTISDQVKEQTR